MTKYQLALIDFYTKNGRKPVFIEKSWQIDENTPMEDILYTYNEMAVRGYLIEERGHFLENAFHYSKKPSYAFLYPSIILDIPFEVHPYVKAINDAFKKELETGKRLSKEEWDKIHELKEW